MYDIFIAPFASFIFLKKALVACLALSLGCAPVGVLLVLRRMSLMGDALSHSIMPGVAIGYLIAGLSLPVMGIGGIIAGLGIAFLATFVTRHTQLQEDASFVGLYLIALAFGTILISLKGNSVDLTHILFGTILSVNTPALLLIAIITTLTLLTLAVIYRPLILECFDPGFMKALGAKGAFYHTLFMALVVLNMVAAFQGLGILMALGLMMLPAVAARFWAQQIWSLWTAAFAIAFVSGYLGLVFSYHFELPSGPAIILVAGVFYFVSLTLGRHGSLLTRKNTGSS
ncbi:MAG: metal ABC transporter permease [Alphaproteobacteria bacterium]|jgi:zinc/manganese transport system permease protein|nr:metal ABC transporter permease [Alphaproteobacteria bacterium]